MHSVQMRTGVKFGDVKMVDTMLKDGLTDAFHGYHMGVTGKNNLVDYFFRYFVKDMLKNNSNLQFIIESMNKV